MTDGTETMAPAKPEAGDLAAIAARFGAALRDAGLPVGPGRCERFAAAVTVARPSTPRALYLCALTTLVSSKDHALILRAVFDQIFGGLGDRDDDSGGPDQGGSQGPPGELPDSSSENLLTEATR